MEQNQAQCQFFGHVLKVSMFNASLFFMLCNYCVGCEYDGGGGAVSTPRLACEGQMTTFSNHVLVAGTQFSGTR